MIQGLYKCIECGQKMLINSMSTITPHFKRQACPTCLAEGRGVQSIAFQGLITDKKVSESEDVKEIETLKKSLKAKKAEKKVKEVKKPKKDK